MTLSYQHRFIPATDPGRPPLLMLHGTGGNENDLIPLAQKLSPGSAVLSPRGDVDEGGQLRFFRRFSEGVFDLDDVRQRTNTLADFVATAAQTYGFPLQQLVAVGFSNGANIAATLLQLRPETLGGAVLLRPMVVLDAPARPSSLAGRGVLIASGKNDPIVSNDHPPHLATLLRAGGAQVDVVHHQAAHALAAADLEAARAFFSLD